MDVLIREPVPADAEPVGRLHAAAWQVAYAGIMPGAVLETMTPQRRIRMWHRVIAAPRAPRERILVAQVDGEVVGFAWTGHCRDEGSPDARGELQAINLHPDRWGGGIGTALIEAAHRELAGAGFTEAVLWVLPGNARARRFYEARGWRADGVQRVELEDGAQIAEIRYARGLTGIVGAGA